jgi:hypothetical protein
MRLRLFGFFFSTLAALILPGTATAQLYMSGAGGVYSNLESNGLTGRFALGAAPLDWIKVEGAAFASGHDQACCSIALDATGWLTVMGVGPVSLGLGGGAGVISYVDIDDPSQEYDWTPYFISGVEAEFELTRHFAFFSRGELGLGELRGYAGIKLGF